MIHYNDSLSHHGVKGMKWGVRKDKYKSMSRSERKAQRNKVRNSYFKSMGSAEKKHRDDWDKKNLKRVEKAKKGPNADDRLLDLYYEREKHVTNKTHEDMIKKYGDKTVNSILRREKAASIAASAPLIAASAAIPIAVLYGMRR